MKKQSPLLLLRPRSSMAMVLGLFGLHALALAAAWLSALPWPVSLGLTFALVASIRMALHAMGRVRELQWGAGETWRLQLADGRMMRAVLDAQASRSLPWWITLAFRLDGGGRLYCWLPRGSLPVEGYRRLRVKLRVEAGGETKEPKTGP